MLPISQGQIPWRFPLLFLVQAFGDQVSNYAIRKDWPGGGTASFAGCVSGENSCWPSCWHQGHFAHSFSPASLPLSASTCWLLLPPCICHRPAGSTPCLPVCREESKEPEKGSIQMRAGCALSATKAGGERSQSFSGQCGSLGSSGYSWSGLSGHVFLCEPGCVPCPGSSCLE